MKFYTYRHWGVSLLCLLVLAGCGPSLSQEELAQMEAGNTPLSQDTNFQQALRTLGRLINTDGEAQKTFLVAQIGNSTGKEEVPPEITNMVISGVNQVAGPYLLHAAQYPAGDSSTGNIGQKETTLIISGTISEFDQDISIKEHGWDLNFFISPEIEDEIVDVDLNAEFNRAETMSRITIDFHLIDVATGLYLPHVNCTNSILIYDIQKNRQWRFIIYGSGFTRWGKIQVKQGAHEAVRKLVDYSMLELFGAYYGLPYWRALGLESPQVGRELLTEWRQRFLSQEVSEQVLDIQRFLLKYPLQEVYVQGLLKTREAIYEEGGVFGSITQAFTLKFLYQYDSRSHLIPYVEQGVSLQQAGFLGDLYMTLIQHVPMI